MKHLLNDLSHYEKNRILEQYNSSLYIDTKKFNRLIESELGNVKPLMEQDYGAYPELGNIDEELRGYGYYYVPGGNVFKYETQKNDSKIELSARIRDTNVSPHSPISGKRYTIKTYSNKNNPEAIETKDFDKYTDISLDLHRMISVINKTKPIPMGNKD